MATPEQKQEISDLICTISSTMAKMGFDTKIRVKKIFSFSNAFQQQIQSMIDIVHYGMMYRTRKVFVTSEGREVQQLYNCGKNGICFEYKARRLKLEAKRTCHREAQRQKAHLNQPTEKNEEDSTTTSSTTTINQ